MSGEGSDGSEPEPGTEPDLSDDETAVLDALGDFTSDGGHAPSYAALADALDTVEAYLLGASPTLTRVQVASRAGVPLELAERLWQWLGFPRADNDDVAFAESDVEALQMAADLMRMGILDEDSQAALVRTWGRSYARLAEWQTTLLAGIAVEGPDPDVRLAELAAGVLPRVEALQTYVWRRHLASAASRLMSTGTGAGHPEKTLAVCFVDIVGYTSQSKNLSDQELVEMVERFEQQATEAVTEGGGRVIKTIGDEILFVADEVCDAAQIALRLTDRGQDDDDPFPAVRAGIALGAVVSRLGDVYGPTVNIASRLTSAARPGTVVVDRGAHDALELVEDPDDPTEADADGPDSEDGDSEPEAVVDLAEQADQPDPGKDGEEENDEDDDPEDDGETDTEDAAPTRPAFRFKRLRRISVKGYSRLEAWALRHPKERQS